MRRSRPDPAPLDVATLLATYTGRRCSLRVTCRIARSWSREPPRSRCSSIEVKTGFDTRAMHDILACIVSMARRWARTATVSSLGSGLRRSSVGSVVMGKDVA